MRKDSWILTSLLLILSTVAQSQADNEIQVYASPTIQKKATIFELHTNYTFKGMKELPDPKSARWLNGTLEITHGFGNNFELGFYMFTALDPNGELQYHGNQLRPRVSVPQNWNWPLGASLSVEFGFFRPDNNAEFFWQGEIRPIIDKTWDKFYISFNPNIDFVLTGSEKGWGLAPQLKSVYSIKQQTIGLGFEYYGSLGKLNDLDPLKSQEHLLGPMVDLYFDPKWEFNAGWLFGLTEGSNQSILKVLVGRRINLKNN